MKNTTQKNTQQKNTRQRDTRQKFSPITVALHWLVGVMMIAMLAVGTVMAEFKIYPLYDTHKSIGVIALAFILWRIVWRIQNGWPQMIVEMPRWQEVAARVSHWVLICGTVVMPVSGVVMSGAGGYGVAVFGLPLIAETGVAGNEALAEFAHGVHHWGGNLLIAFVVVHLAAALRHHFVQKDGVLRRMLGKG